MTVMTLEEFERFVKTECCGAICTFASDDQDCEGSEIIICGSMDFEHVLVFSNANMKCVMLKNNFGFLRLNGVNYIELENLGLETAVVAVCGGINGIPEQRYRFYFWRP